VRGFSAVSAAFFIRPSAGFYAEADKKLLPQDDAKQESSATGRLSGNSIPVASDDGDAFDSGQWRVFLKTSSPLAGRTQKLGVTS
jgi:hypothetical protein